MAYLHTHLGVARFVAKIGSGNAPSLALFQDRLGFSELRRVEVGGLNGGGWCRRGHKMVAARVPLQAPKATELALAAISRPATARAAVHAALQPRHWPPPRHARQVFDEVHLQLELDAAGAAALAERGRRLQLGEYL